MNKKRASRYPILGNLLLDAALAGMLLVVFALFHHVLPREQESLSIAIQNPYAVKAEIGSTAEKSVETATSNNVSENITSEDALSSSMEISAEAVPSSAYSPTVYSAESAKSASMSGKGSRNTKGSSGGPKSRGAGSSSKGGSAISGESAAEENTTPLETKFSEKYTEETVITDTAYTSPNISISVTRETAGSGSIIYYIADIYVRDITCFQTVLANGTYGSGYRDGIDDMALLSEALLAVNGDYYGNTTEGVVIRNGVIYRANPTDCDVCVLYYDGSMRVIPGSAFSVEEAIADGAWQAWTFGPALLDADGGTISSFNSTNRIQSANPRTAIGYYEPGHYCLVVVDGRGESAGITLPELSKLFYRLGCKSAYNLDGGNSSVMVWQNSIINDPSGGGRESSDALIIAEVKNDA